MKYEVSILLLALGLSSARPVADHVLKIREVPQEHSHNRFLDLVRTSLTANNPKNIVDPVFGLLGNAAAAAGAGAVTNLDCLQQETADQAFTNAKAAGDIGGMAGALVYRALERNTGSVGLASVTCTQTAVNAEIAAVSQHQDPASANAATVNKGIAIALAKQLAAIGADPLLALESGTFAPGTIGDPTAKGNTCDTQNDNPGCIFTQKLLVLDATPAEISAAVAGITPTITGTNAISATDINLAGLPVASGAAVAAGAGAGAATPATSPAAASAVATTAAATTQAQAATSAAVAATNGCGGASASAAPASPATPANTCTVITTTVAASVASSMIATLTSAATVQTSAVPAGTNVQKFTGSLGGPPPPVISSSGARPFSVNGNTFVNAGAALQRSCAIQHNACADAANKGALAGGVAQCDTQEKACNAANTAAKIKRALAERATNFGTCGNPTILFKAGLDGRNTNAFIAADQTSFPHGSALNIAVIAGFICQRLGSPCSAAANVQAACTSASAAAVATSQNQAAADVFNSIIGAGAGAGTGAAVTSAAAAAPAASSVVMTITSC